MSKIIRLISENRFCDMEESHSIARAGEETFRDEVYPLLEKAFPNFNDLQKVDEGISALLSAVQTGCYLDGMRDMAELLTFNGTMDDLYRGNDGGAA